MVCSENCCCSFSVAVDACCCGIYDCSVFLVLERLEGLISRPTNWTSSSEEEQRAFNPRVEISKFSWSTKHKGFRNAYHAHYEHFG